MTVAVAVLGIGVVFAACGTSAQPSALTHSVRSSSTTAVHTTTSVRPAPANDRPVVPAPASYETPLVVKDQTRVTQAANKIEHDNGRLQSDQELAQEEATECTVASGEAQQDKAQGSPSLSSAEESARDTCTRAQAAATQVANDKALLSKDQTNLNGAETALSQAESGG